MHKIAKWVLRIGSALFLLGLLTIMIGGITSGVDTTPESEDWSGTLMFEGETPTTQEFNLNFISTYHVFVEEGKNVSVKLLNGNENNYFEPCEDDDAISDCAAFDVEGNVSGFEYIGEILIDDKGDYLIEFSAENGDLVEVMIREDLMGLTLLVVAGGSISCFGGIILLIVGGILAKVMKEKDKILLIQPNMNGVLESEQSVD
jgi:hypothetical protein